MKLPILFVCLFGAAWAADPPALEGLDPVALTGGQEIPGKEALSAKHGQFTYQFANEENRARFVGDPDRYSIQLDGACARMGAPVGGSPDAYYVYKQRIYVAGSSECYRLFKENPSKYLDSEQAPVPWVFDGAAVQEGKAILDKAARAMGFDAPLDSYSETRSLDGVRINMTLQLPERVRIERVGQNFAATQVITPDSTFVQSGKAVRTIPASFGAATRAGILRDSLALLSLRDRPGFKAAKRPDGDVEVQFEGVRATLKIDPASGRVMGLSSRARGPEGAFGEIALTYSDFRQVGSWTIPFQAKATFDGGDASRLGWTRESFAARPPNVAELFRPPADAK